MWIASSSLSGSGGNGTNAGATERQRGDLCSSLHYTEAGQMRGGGGGGLAGKKARTAEPRNAGRGCSKKNRSTQQISLRGNSAWDLVQSHLRCTEHMVTRKKNREGEGLGQQSVTSSFHHEGKHSTRGELDVCEYKSPPTTNPAGTLAPQWLYPLVE